MRATTIVSMTACLLALTACASAPKAPEPVRLVWPPAPLTARIEFVRSLASDEDVGRDTTFTQRLLNVLSGERPAPNRLVEPMGIAVSDDGQRVYVSDLARRTVCLFDLGARTFKQIGEGGLAHPFGLALDAEERLYVVEQGKKGISVFDREGVFVRSITHPSVERPSGIAIDRRRGRIYLADTATLRSETHTVKVFDMAGNLVGQVGKGKGAGPGELYFPTYLALDADGNLYVSDTMNSRVQVFDPEGAYLRQVGERGNAWGMFDKPKGVAIDRFGNLYVADSVWSNVQIFNQKGRVLLFFGGRGPVPGMLMNPTAVAIDGNNRIYVGDYLNHRVEVYQLVNTTAGDSFLDPVAGTQGGEAGQSADAKTPAAPTPTN